MDVLLTTDNGTLIEEILRLEPFLRGLVNQALPDVTWDDDIASLLDYDSRNGGTLVVEAQGAHLLGVVDENVAAFIRRLDDLRRMLAQDEIALPIGMIQLDEVEANLHTLVAFGDRIRVALVLIRARVSVKLYAI